MFRASIVAACGLILVSTPVFGQDRTWNNASGGNWGTAGNWTPSGAPTGSLTALIGLTPGSPYTVTVNAANRAALGLTIDSSDATLTFDTSTRVLTIGTSGLALNAGTITTAPAGGELRLNGVSTTSTGSVLTIQNSGILRANEALTVDGSFNWSGF